MVAASPQIIKRGAAGAAGCVEGLHRFAQGAKAPAALRVVVSPFGAQRTHFEGALATRKM